MNKEKGKYILGVISIILILSLCLCIISMVVSQAFSNAVESIGVAVDKADIDIIFNIDFNETEMIRGFDEIAYKYSLEESDWYLN